MDVIERLTQEELEARHRQALTWTSRRFLGEALVPPTLLLWPGPDCILPGLRIEEGLYGLPLALADSTPQSIAAVAEASRRVLAEADAGCYAVIVELVHRPLESGKMMDLPEMFLQVLTAGLDRSVLASRVLERDKSGRITGLSEMPPVELFGFEPTGIFRGFLQPRPRSTAVH